jgi:hypothetical protein
MADGNFDGVVAAISDRIVDTFVIRGSPEQCLERMAEFSGVVDSFKVWSATWWGLAGRESLRAMRRLIAVLKDASR